MIGHSKISVHLDGFPERTKWPSPIWCSPRLQLPYPVNMAPGSDSNIPQLKASLTKVMIDRESIQGHKNRLTNGIQTMMQQFP